MSSHQPPKPPTRPPSQLGTKLQSKLKCLVSQEQKGARLDQFLAAAVPDQHGHQLSRRAVRRALQAGAVYVNGKRVRVASRPVFTRDRVEIVIELDGSGGANAVTTEPPPPLTTHQILFEDSDLLIIDKKTGMPSQATQTDAMGNALEQARDYLRRAQRRTADREAPYLVLPHRLDRGTSGALILIKARRANAGMAEAFRHGRVDKVYRLLVAIEDGRTETEDFTIDLGLDVQGRKVEVSSLGLEAVTEVRWIAQTQSDSGNFAILEARPRTGRKHQIRAHLAAFGLPILGDRLYSNPTVAAMARRPMLHAYELSFEHPVHHEAIRVVCPMPEDFTEAASKLGLSLLEDPPDDDPHGGAEAATDRE